MAEWDKNYQPATNGDFEREWIIANRPRSTVHLIELQNLFYLVGGLKADNPEKQKRPASLQAFVPRAGVEPARV